MVLKQLYTESDRFSFYDTWEKERSLYYAGPLVLPEGPQSLFPFGMLQLQDSLYLDITEVPVVAYREYYHAMGLRAEVKPRFPFDYDSLYFSNPAMQFHPMVSVTKEQADGYCRWRGAVVNQQIALRRLRGEPEWEQDGEPLQVFMRLPTEEEFLVAASGGLDTTQYRFGYATLLQDVEFTSQDIEYLQERFWFRRSTAQIEAELERFVAGGNKMPVFNVRWPYAPSSLRLPIPTYVYSFRPNPLGFYHLVGNVSEWIGDRSYVMGGNFRQSINDFVLQEGEEMATENSTDVGFRCACILATQPPDNY